ncbi:MAG: hypothetical protein Q3999_05220 [Buchananella hordeovulneris]|nr:hypothetical protein [Buchananella hordeovulneris]
MNPRIPAGLSRLAAPPVPRLELPLLDDGRLDCLTLHAQPDWSKRAPLFVPLLDGPVESTTRAEQLIERIYMARVLAVAAQLEADMLRAALLAYTPPRSDDKRLEAARDDMAAQVAYLERLAGGHHTHAQTLLATALGIGGVLADRDTWMSVVTVSLPVSGQGVAA